ncbi:MAG: large conductance mechanosensitive channel protein MscL [Bacteroidota bacterium]
MLKEFKEFAMRGNVVDLAVGVIIGAAFGRIVDSIVKDLIMPLVGIIGEVDFSNKYIPLSEKIKAKMLLPDGSTLALDKAREIGPVFAWGNFITILINFMILAFIIFLLIKGMNNLMRKKAESPSVPPAPTKEEVLLTEIRDALRAKS